MHPDHRHPRARASTDPETLLQVSGIPTRRDGALADRAGVVRRVCRQRRKRSAKDIVLRFGAEKTALLPALWADCLSKLLVPVCGLYHVVQLL